jgi:hypothetical protein
MERVKGIEPSSQQRQTGKAEICLGASSKEWQKVADPPQHFPSEDPGRMQRTKALATVVVG